MLTKRQWVWLFLISLCTVVLVFALEVYRYNSYSCNVEQISTLTSPDRQWIASVREEICSSPGIATTGISDVVRLARRNKQKSAGDVFVLSGDGDARSRPHIRWISNDHLEITVPNTSLIGLNKNSFDGVSIMIKFDPNDPVARRQFLKKMGLRG